ncbi:ribulose bisphosphate carboxylase small subunit [Phormidium tenue]|uniref:Ribulose 1,5-bisphosphate carboxylase n=1 Tax=Phormidium tenue NIES-30 TaxID=549789 RepID=A0A1U7J1J9_9CYAN|nr:ribulose bisphosphate carboxylase small subunit [Phormidium tenue]MBD2233804.1 ribulose bisphosphate carboxylase small subunit [Phormidium tenue FACHB-1052]OKH45721.1 ribulose 1,5-bisphosphate carboxylase [Phormidium tenue NIES-30]
MAYYLSPRFLEKLAVHITKNYLKLPQVKIPLLLGVHGRKGEGKTFQCELVYERMGIEVVHISGGELESPDAGDPARLIRLRYREAAELVRVRGKMAVLMINDIDAGAGRFDALTQYTVNTQLVNNTLMNIADNPTNVQLPGSYDENEIQRVPIIMTGNDLSTLYAPLIRDGRMDKFYWQPDRDDRIGIVGGIFKPDGLSSQDITLLVDTFPTQAIDFFGAVRAQIYNEQIRDFIYSVGLENVSRSVVNTTTPPSFRKPDFSISHLLEVGDRLVREQRRVDDMRLANEYNRVLQSGGASSAPDGSFYRAYDPAAAAPDPASPSGNGDSPQCPMPTARETTYSPSPPPPHSPTPHSSLPPEVRDQVNHILAQGYRLALEHVNQRRFQTNAWQSGPTISAQDAATASAVVARCLSDHAQDYVRLIGIDPKTKQRVMEQIIQRPQR